MLRNDLAEEISLDGTWDFRLGIQSDWREIQVPGCWEAQGYSAFQDGPAVYSCRFTVPDHWQGMHIQAEFEAVSYAASFSLNQLPLGEHQGLWTPFALDITSAVRFGQENVLEVVVYKPGERYPLRSCLAGFLPDVATAFGGLWGSVKLRSMLVGLDNLKLYTDYQTGTLRIRTRALLPGLLVDPEWEVKITSQGDTLSEVKIPWNYTGELDFTSTFHKVRVWYPDKPVLYEIQVTLQIDHVPAARLSGQTGFRSLEARGSQLTLNGESVMVRGILSWGWDPDRISPRYTRQQALEEIRRVKQMGFNLIKLCLFIPNQEYFDAADEEGMLLWQEFPLWLPEVTAGLRRQAPVEYAAMATLTRQHPSVVLYSLGCELNKSIDEDLLQQLDGAVRSQVSDVLVCDNSGSGESYGGLQVDFSDFTDYHPYYDLHYFEPLLDHWRRDWQEGRPWIFGEFNDADTFRDAESIIQANQGFRPWWMTAENPVTTWRPESMAMLESRNRLALADLPFTAPEMTKVSYAQTQVVRKFTLESLRRRAGIGGYIVTGLRDTPISTSGIWDDFENPKWDAQEFRLVNDEAVLCLDVGRKRKWTHGGDRPDRLDAHNFWSDEEPFWHVILHSTGMQFPAGSELSWKLTDQEEIILRQGIVKTVRRTIPGMPVGVGTITCNFPRLPGVCQLKLQVELISGSETVKNIWPVWVYPPLDEPPKDLRVFDPAGVYDDSGSWLAQVPRLHTCASLAAGTLLLTNVWDESIASFLDRGGRVIVTQQSGRPFPSQRSPFWRESVNLFYDHPLWDRFIHPGYTDLQFFGLASDTALDSQELVRVIPGLTEVRPVLRRLDTRQFRVSDYLIEARSGRGLLLVSTLRLQGGAGAQPSGWQRSAAGGALLQAMLNYLLKSI